MSATVEETLYSKQKINCRRSLPTAILVVTLHSEGKRVSRIGKHYPYVSSSSHRNDIRVLDQVRLTSVLAIGYKKS